MKESRPKKKYILYGSIYVKFQKIKTNIQKQKAGLWLLGDEGHKTGIAEGLLLEVVDMFIDCGDDFTSIYLCQI